MSVAALRSYQGIAVVGSFNGSAVAGVAPALVVPVIKGSKNIAVCPLHG